MQTFESKLVYILGMVLDSYFQQIVSGQVMSFWRFQCVFKIDWHLFVVFL